MIKWFSKIGDHPVMHMCHVPFNYSSNLQSLDFQFPTITEVVIPEIKKLLPNKFFFSKIVEYGSLE